MWYAADGHEDAAVSRLLLWIQRVSNVPQRGARQRVLQGRRRLDRGPPRAQVQLLHHRGGDHGVLK